MPTWQQGGGGEKALPGSARLSAPGEDAPLAAPGHLLTANPPFPGSLGFPGERLKGKGSTKQETQARSLTQEDPLEEEMAAHSSVLAWEIPWMEEPGGLQSELQRVVHD